MRYITLLLAFVLPVTSISQTAKPLTSRDIMTSMLSAIDKNTGLKYTFKSYERIIGKTDKFYTEMEMKANINPLKVYGLTKSDPNKGVEVLYVAGERDNKALVNPGSWLPNVKLDPYGDRMRENQHHTVLQAGFGFLAQIIRSAMKRAETEKPGQFESFFRYDGEMTWQGRQCYKITINDPDFKYVDYTVQAGDDINKIEARFGICGYLIIEKNPGVVKGFDSLKPGMKIKIPSSYAKKTVLYIDKQHYMPVVQIMYDEVGEFEKYEFHNLVVNPSFAGNEFTSEFDGYDF